MFGPSAPRKLFFILKGLEVDLCGIKVEAQERMLT